MSEAAILTERRSYVAGTWIEGDEVLAVEDPADGSHVADISVTPLREIRRAVAEARRTFDDGVWAHKPAKERAAALRSFLEYVETERDRLIATMVAEAGQPTRFAE